MQDSTQQEVPDTEKREKLEKFINECEATYSAKFDEKTAALPLEQKFDVACSLHLKAITEWLADKEKSLAKTLLILASLRKVEALWNGNKELQENTKSVVTYYQTLVASNAVAGDFLEALGIK